MSDDRHEARFLLAIVRESWGEARDLAARRAPDPGRFVSLARACDIEPWLQHRLAASGNLGLVGPAVAETLAAARRRCRVDNLVLFVWLERTLDRLLAEGIAPVLLKGGDLLHRFPVPLDARTMDDIDLLIAPREVARVLALLEGAGWELPPEPARTHWLRSSYQMPAWSPGPARALVEIHWSLGQSHRYQMDTDELLSRALPLDVAGRSVRRLHPHDVAAHLLIHHLQHYFDRKLKWAVDLRLLSQEPDFSWEGVADRLGVWGGRSAAGMSLLHLRKLFPDWFPLEATRAIRCATWRRIVTAPLRSAHPLDYFRGTRRRPVQLYLAACLYERPARLGRYLLHRTTRDSRPSAGPGV